jgi:hypothetical protein
VSIARRLVYLKDYGEDIEGVIRPVDGMLAKRSNNSKGDPVSEHEDKKLEDEDAQRMGARADAEPDIEGHKLAADADVMDEADVEGHKFSPKHEA